MNRALLLPWNPVFFSQSPMYQPILKWAEYYRAFQSWPGLADYQAQLDSQKQDIKTLAGKKLTIVEQDGKPGHFEEHYAPRIYLTGEIQTRRENWHDFFQFISWMMFPKTKAVINSIHIPAAQKRINEDDEKGRRTPIENMLSLFDEGGVVLVSSDRSLLDLVRDFNWKELFWHRRNELADKFSCITFGHAMYEKGLSPYIGMTANSILLEVDDSFFSLSNDEQLAVIDDRLVTIFEERKDYSKPSDLSPFPVLGMPGWDRNNDKEEYYDNQDYFRPGRMRHKKKA